MQVYAIVSAGRSVHTIRAGSGRRLRTISRGAVAAVVGDRSRPAAPSPANLRRYDRTMRALAERLPAIIPARFGTLMAEDELLLTLSSRQAAFMRVLAGVRRRVQMTVRVVTGPEARLPVTRTSPAIPSSGRDYLLARARDAAAARAVPGFEPVRRSVARWVRDERVDHRVGVSSVYHLIPRSSTAAYRRAVEASAAASGLTVIVSGPWPPYAFSSE